MSIIRGPRPETGWTQVANSAVRDPRLSFKAVGILTYVLSLPEGASTDRDALAEAHSEGRESVRSGLTELRDAGYLVRRQRRTGGRFVTDTYVYDTPEAAAAAVAGDGASLQVAPLTGFPTSGEPTSVEPTSGDPYGKNLEPPYSPEVSREPSSVVTEDQKNKNIRVAEMTTVELAFDDFWTRYPRKTAKGQARTAFTKAIKKAPAETIIRAAERYARDPNRDPGYTRHASTWLNGECWEDEALPPRVSNGNGHERAWGEGVWDRR